MAPLVLLGACDGTLSGGVPPDSGGVETGPADRGVVEAAPPGDGPLDAAADAAQPQPDAAQPKPDAAQPKPDAAQPKPDAAQPAPDAAQPKPDAAQPAPDAAQPAPDQGTTTTKAYFPSTSIWYTDHSTAAVHSNSAAIISWLQNAGGWGSGQLRIDFSIEVLNADASTPMKSFVKTSDWYSPDCDFTTVPVPTVGAIEGESGYACTNNGDCHLIVAHWPTMKLYEMWRANITSTTFYGGCLAIWDMTKAYGPLGRGDQCTSADAAGFPIAPLLFSADEVKAGAINHAIRFILPNSRIRSKVYVRPATHSTNATSGGANAPQYGVHLRLKAGTNISALKPGAQVVAKALKKYGMFLADGGTIALTAQSDTFTTAKWTNLLGSYDLASLQVTDFEVIYHSADIAYTGNCVRVP